MKKVIGFLSLFLLVFVLGGCDYQTAQDNDSINKSSTIKVKTVEVSQFYNSNDGYSLSIPSGNKSTCIWTYEGGNAAIPDSTTTQATITEKHIITFPADSLNISLYNFKVSCTDDFGNQYVGDFPKPSYSTSTDVKNEKTTTTTDNSIWNW